jgi:hypothetical protein
LTNTLPTTGEDGIEAFVAKGYVDAKGSSQTAASPKAAIGDYFPAMGIRLLRGRFFTAADDANGQLVVIVNHQLSKHYWPNQDPVGRRMRMGTPTGKTPWMTVVGEVADTKLTSPDADAGEQFYRPVAQLEKDSGAYASPTDINGNGGFIVLRSALPPQQMENALRAAVQSIDPQLPLARVQTMEQVVSSSEAPHRFNTVIISIFCSGRRVAGYARRLQRDCFFRCSSRTRDGHPHSPRLAACRYHASDPAIRFEASRDRVCPWLGGSGRSFWPLALLPLWGESLRPGHHDNGRSRRIPAGSRCLCAPRWAGSLYRSHAGFARRVVEAIEPVLGRSKTRDCACHYEASHPIALAAQAHFVPVGRQYMFARANHMRASDQRAPLLI